MSSTLYDQDSMWDQMFVALETEGEYNAKVAEDYEEVLYLDNASVENYIGVIRNLENLIEGAKNQERYFKEKRSRFESRIRFLKERILDFLECTNQKSVETSLGKVTRQKSSAASVILDVDPEHLAPEYVREIHKVEADKKAIKAALQEGIEVDGARLAPVKEYIRIT